jgi:hypothetical protein
MPVTGLNPLDRWFSPNVRKELRFNGTNFAKEVLESQKDFARRIKYLKNRTFFKQKSPPPFGRRLLGAYLNRPKT